MDAPPAVLQWDRGALGAECERAAIVKAGVEDYLGRSAFAAEGPLSIRVRLFREERKGRQRVIAKVTQEGSDGRAWGEREVEGESDCASLDEPLTLVVALMVDVPAQPPTTPEPPPQEAPPPAPEPRAPANSEPPATSTGEIETAPSLERVTTPPGHVVLQTYGLISMGASPTTAAGAGALVSIKPRGFWGVALDAAATLPARAGLGPGSLETSLLVVGVGLCPLQGIADGVWWSGCGGAGVARLHAKSRHLLGARSHSDWFALPSLAVRAGRLLGRRWLIAGGLSAAFPVSADHYVYRSADGEKLPAFQPSALVLTAQVGVGILLD